MRIRILGSSAGGGVPQWNCRCANCAAARAGSPDVVPRTQSSLAISGDGKAWFLVNVSPDVRQQIMAFPELGPPITPPPEITGSSSLSRAEAEWRWIMRSTAVAGCVLTDAEFDHTAGLLLLREQPLRIFCTPTVHRWLGHDFPVEKMLAGFHDPTWTELPLDVSVELPLADDAPSGLKVHVFELDRHVPKYVSTDSGPAVGAGIGLHIKDVNTGGSLLYAPCLPVLNATLKDLATDSDCVMIDGTFWCDDEPLRLGIGGRSARAMGHLPVDGADGSLAWLGALDVRHRLYVHINNTNPMLNVRGPEHAQVRERGVQVAVDGAEFAV